MTRERARALIAKARSLPEADKAIIRAAIRADLARKRALADSFGTLGQAMELPPADRLALAHKIMADAKGGAAILPRMGMPARRGMIF
jgi:hypothetical protein